MACLLQTDFFFLSTLAAFGCPAVGILAAVCGMQAATQLRRHRGDACAPAVIWELRVILRQGTKAAPGGCMRLRIEKRNNNTTPAASGRSDSLRVTLHSNPTSPLQGQRIKMLYNGLFLYTLLLQYIVRCAISRCAIKTESMNV